MAKTGFNSSKVSNAIANVSSAYVNIMNALIEKNETSFVIPMSYIWGSSQAKKFFLEYQSVITSMSSEVTTIFKSIVDAMSSAAGILATIAGTSWETKELSAVKRILDISSIKEEINGVIGIDQTQAVSVADQLDSILQAVSEGLQEAKTAVDNSGFIGGEIPSRLVSSLGKIEANISNSFSSLKQQAHDTIQGIANTYTTTSANVSSSFGGLAN